MSDEKKPYRVGPGKPPREHAFKKGQSGNRLGRPPKKTKPSMFNLAQIIMDEANEPIKIKDGDRSTTLPAIQVILKQQRRTATQGDTKAAKIFVENVTAAHLELQKQKHKQVDMALEYKELAEQYLERFAGCGRPPPVLHLDPADVLIDVDAPSVNLSARSQYKRQANSRILEDYANQLSDLRGGLKALLAAAPDNECIAKDLDSAETLLLHVQRALEG